MPSAAINNNYAAILQVTSLMGDGSSTLTGVRFVCRRGNFSRIQSPRFAVQYFCICAGCTWPYSVGSGLRKPNGKITYPLAHIVIAGSNTDSNVKG